MKCIFCKCDHRPDIVYRTDNRPVLDRGIGALRPAPQRAPLIIKHVQLPVGRCKNHFTHAIACEIFEQQRRGDQLIHNDQKAWKGIAVRITSVDLDDCWLHDDQAIISIPILEYSAPDESIFTCSYMKY